jgi:hypothetical protein
MSSRRLAAVKGTFYPDNCNKLSIYFQKFTDAIGTALQKSDIFKLIPKAIIVPHAGYIYSGFTANVAYKLLSNTKAKRIIIIGPSHRHYFQGISGSYYESYETPCGDMPIDSDYLIALAKKHNIGFEPKAHAQEHSTEVQVPFIKHYLGDRSIIEFVYGDISAELVSEIIITLLEDKENAVVISTDLSHFYDQTKANQLDEHCLQAISKLDLSELGKGCEACGMIGVKAMIVAAKKLQYHSQLLDYRTSADYSGDKSRVVGYTSAIFY